MPTLKQMLTPYVPEDIGQIYQRWEFPEFVNEKKSKKWLIGVSALVLALIIYAIISANLLFAMILAISVFIVILQGFQDPRPVEVSVGEDGIVVGNKFYPYRALASFWIVYEPPRSKYLYLDFKNSVKKSLPIPLEEANPLEIRAALLNHLDEDIEKEGEELDEIFSRLFKLR